MTIQPYEPQPTQTVVYGEVDSWVPVLASVGDLAAKIAQTDFVPDSLKGKPAAVAAAILAGREMGIGPMTALQNIHVIKGKPGQSAQLMRSLVLAAGHSIRFVETTDTRCVVEGRRRGEEEWERVTFTADQARKAKIDLGSYPEDKLVARATGRLCRRKFADCLAGMPYSVEELEDGEHTPAGEVVAIEGGSAKPRRTAQRKTTATATTAAPAPSGVTQPGPAESKAAPLDQVPPPPLPGEEDDQGDESAPDPITDAQMRKVQARFNELGITERESRLALTRALIDAPDLSSAKDLTKAQASALIDVMEDEGVSDASDLYAAAGLLEDPS